MGGDANRLISLIDQMYEGLQPIKEKEFLDLVQKHRQMLEDEIMEEQKKLGIASQIERDALEGFV